MAGKPHKRYGAVPTARIRVQIQEHDGTRVVQTLTYSIYGQELSDVKDAVETTLDEHFGDTAETVEAPATVRPKLKKRRT